MEKQMTSIATARAIPPHTRPCLRRDALLRRIRGEYEEMPGHALSIAQAQRMWNLPQSQCERLLRILVRDHFLSRTALGLFVRADAGRAGA
jgi:hypothetical protein